METHARNAGTPYFFNSQEIYDETDKEQTDENKPANISRGPQGVSPSALGSLNGPPSGSSGDYSTWEGKLATHQGGAGGEGLLPPSPTSGRRPTTTSLAGRRKSIAGFNEKLQRGSSYARQTSQAPNRSPDVGPIEGSLDEVTEVEEIGDTDEGELGTSCWRHQYAATHPLNYPSTATSPTSEPDEPTEQLLAHGKSKKSKKSKKAQGTPKEPLLPSDGGGYA